MSDIVYLYGFVPADAPSPPADLAGVADEPVALLELGDVCAVISRLPAGEFAGDVVESKLQDMAWVGQQGLAHERVVLWFVDHAQILPARLFSLYSGEATLRGALSANTTRIATQLAALGDRREWNLKVAYDAAELARHGAEVSAEVRALDADIAAAPPGRRYLMQRKRADLLSGELGNAARRIAAELLDGLAEHADASRTLPLAAAEAAAGTVVMNAALLVKRSREDGLRAAAETAVARVRKLGVIATFSGPWAPYRFLEEVPHD
jgi:hypothetical protein